MKTRLVIIVLLLAMLTILISRNDERITDALLGLISPVKQSYTNFTQNLEKKSNSYIFQKESIEKLSIENRILRKRLLEQMHYIEEIKSIYDILPNLTHFPNPNIAIVETISYAKLNSFSQLILTKPKNLKENKLYGMIQNDVVAGIASVRSNQLYGYLTSDERCLFSVFVGKNRAPGIAMGHKTNEMLVKFIPKWHNIQPGDKVYTSGLDNIFFANFPVGIVTKVEVQSSYTVAYLKTYSDIFHPKTFFLITDARETLAEGFDSNKTDIPHPQTERTDQNAVLNNTDANITVLVSDINQTEPVVSSIPSRIDQTQEDTIEPTIPQESEEVPEPKVIKKKVIRKKKKRKRRVKKRRSVSNTLDLF